MDDFGVALGTKARYFAGRFTNTGVSGNDEEEFVCLSACLLALPVERAAADELRDMNLVVEGWTYTPVEVDGEVPVLVALRNPDQLPAGITGLYATEGADGTWDIEAWSNASYEEIVLFLAEHLE